jgi:hypothetical protein
MFDTADPGGEKPCVCGHLTLFGFETCRDFSHALKFIVKRNSILCWGVILSWTRNSWKSWTTASRQVVVQHIFLILRYDEQHVCVCPFCHFHLLTLLRHGHPSMFHMYGSIQSLGKEVVVQPPLETSTNYLRKRTWTKLKEASKGFRTAFIHFCGTMHHHLPTCRNANASRLTFSIRLVSSLHMRGMLYSFVFS